MKSLKDVKSYIYPIEIDEKSSPFIVYVRSNIRIKDDIYYYDEIQYTKDEYEKIKLNNKLELLKQENADLLLDSAIKDARILQTEKDLADLILQVATIGGI